MIPAIVDEVDGAVSHVETRDDVALSDRMSVGQLSQQAQLEGEDVVQPTRADGPVIITPCAMSTSEVTPTLATKSTDVPVQGTTKAEIDTEWEDVITPGDASTSKKTKQRAMSSMKRTKTSSKSSKMKGESIDAVKRSDEGQVGVPVKVDVQWEDIRVIGAADAACLDSAKAKLNTARRRKKKKTKRLKKETRVAHNDAAADNVVAAIGKLSLSNAKPTRRASLRISLDESDAEIDED
jgi:hypothetical protein